MRFFAHYLGSTRFYCGWIRALTMNPVKVTISIHNPTTNTKHEELVVSMRFANLLIRENIINLRSNIFHIYIIIFFATYSSAPLCILIQLTMFSHASSLSWILECLVIFDFLSELGLPIFSSRALNNNRNFYRAAWKKLTTLTTISKWDPN